MTSKDIINLFSKDPIEISPHTIIVVVVCAILLTFGATTFYMQKEKIEASVTQQLVEIKDSLKNISLELNQLRAENANLRLEVAVLKRELELRGAVIPTPRIRPISANDPPQ
jgi:hypothetical protein